MSEENQTARIVATTLPIISAASARAQKARLEAFAVRDEARYRGRPARVGAVVVQAERVGRELLELDLEILVWDGVDPPLEQLSERFEALEAQLTKIETKLCALRPRPFA